MNSTAPNLFHYANKELAQDAALAYILAWAKPVYQKTHSRLHELGTALLRGLLASKPETAIPTVTSLEVETQFKRIDLLALINVKNEDGLVLLVEDKVDTDEHSNQIERYIKTAEKRYPNRQIVPVYVKTGNVSLHYLPSPDSCGRFLRRDLLAVLNRFTDTGDTIVDNFRTNLQGWEYETNSYRDVGVDDWQNPQFEGFYDELENRMAKESKWHAHWQYANNRAGGVLWFACAENTLAQEPHEVIMYLQIDDATRLTVRLGEWSGPGIRAPLMYKVLERLEENARQTEDIKIKKAGRFNGGETAAVAEITFGDEDGYLALTDGGIVNMDETMRRLDRAREFVSKVASLYRG